MTEPSDNSNLSFQTTNPSLIRLAADRDPAALNQLLHQYRPALRSYLRRRYRIAPDRADDVVQDFILSKLIGDRGNLLLAVDWTRGRFRSLLARALDNFYRDLVRAEQAQKRQVDRAGSLDEVLQGPVEAADAASLFDLSWASEVLEAASQRLREACEREGGCHWELLEARLKTPPDSYKTLCQRFNLRDTNQVSNALRTAQNRLVQHVREVLQEQGYALEQLNEAMDEVKTIILTRPRA